MSAYKSDFLQQAHLRGFIHQGTDLDKLDHMLTQGPLTAYIGFDATADCLHAGSLLPIMLLRLYQKTGHKPIVLMGGGTTKVGDPSGKDTSRQMLDDEQIDYNLKAISNIFKTYLSFGDGPTDATLLDNRAWLDPLNYIEFLRDYGPHFTINRMLTFDSVKLRLEREQPLTFLEFNYMILQAFDFTYLAKNHNCQLQMGGSDQWGNIVNGIELGRRTAQMQLFGLTSPLITTSAGEKMGKTASGAIWLRKDKLSTYDFWQYWRNTPDRDVGKFLRLFTELPVDEILKLENLKDKEINEAKKILADEVTRLLHGQEAVDEAKSTAENLFENNKMGDLAGLPIVEISAEQLTLGISLVDLLVKTALVESKSEARRLIRGGGARLNDTAIQEEDFMVTTASLTDSSPLKVSAGKKKHALVKITGAAD
ncbi:MAG: tyrosine--tRNA ligase [Alphaproteobacteria bacterium]|nr:tyrosine--tRNA ligase [Alphaproteobacteria bacterium]